MRIPAEHAVLLNCARVQMPPARQEDLRRLLSDGVDWDHLMRLGRRHGLLPLLYWHVKALPTDLIDRTVPSETLAGLREQFHGNSMRCLALGDELHRILSLLGEHGIVAVPLKGVALSTWLYCNPVLRQPGDLDILVRPTDAPAAMALLMRLQYRPQTTARMTGAQRHAMAHFLHELAFHRVAPHAAVDLHWRLLSPLLDASTDFEGMWDRLDTTSVRGRPIPILGAADTLAHLCVHGSSHGWGCLKWVCDVAELLRRSPDLDWSGVARRAHRRQPMLWLGLALAHELLDAPLPPAVRTHIEGSADLGRVVAQTSDRLLDRPVSDASPVIGVWADVLASAALKPAPDDGADAARHAQDRATSLAPLLLGHDARSPAAVALVWLRFGLTPTLRQIERVSLPPWLFPVYYAMRLARVLHTTVVGAGRTLSHRLRHIAVSRDPAHPRR